MKKTFNLLSVIKKRAKQLKKGKPSLTWHQALDEAAKELGFSNFKNYKNVSESILKEYKSAKKALLKDISSENNLVKKMEHAVSFIQNYEASFRDILGILQQFQHSEETIQTACEKLNLMQTKINEFLLNDFLTDEGQDEINFRAPYFVAKEIRTNDLTYELIDDTLYVDGNYVLSTQFEFELDEDDPISKDGRFKDRKFSGSFGVEIDSNKKITMMHSDMDIGNGLTEMSTFTEDEIEDYYKHFPNEHGRFDDILVLDDHGYDDIKRCLSNNKPLTEKTLELALELVEAHGDDEYSKFIRNIGVKMKAGQPLDAYEHHILVDVLMLHAQLGS